VLISLPLSLAPATYVTDIPQRAGVKLGCVCAGRRLPACCPTFGLTRLSQYTVHLALDPRALEVLYAPFTA
jgi:hypothetical protein